ncbi:DUF805 domain-containing protein [Lysinibacter cavernae]|uniref:DUF805 domain-containing protein n=1 Tax=Lysinibacter cavernae TaxID=1640652 RepID=UPI0036124AD8
MQTHRFLSTTKLVTFKGRATRRSFWLMIMIQSIVNFTAFSVAGHATGYDGSTNFVTQVVALIFVLWWAISLVPCLAIAVRRLHDTNKSGLFLIIWFIPIIGPILLLVFFCKSSDLGVNAFGSPAADAACQQPARQ